MPCAMMLCNTACLLHVMHSSCIAPYCMLVSSHKLLDVLQRADLEAAQLYDDFVASFGGEEEKKRPKAFVTGGTIQPGSKPTAGNQPCSLPPVSPSLHTLRTNIYAQHLRCAVCVCWPRQLCSQTLCRQLPS